MKTISANLKAAIANGRIATLFAIIAQDGTSRYFTDHNLTLTVDGKIHTPSAGVGRVSMKVTNDAEVSNQEVTATIVEMPESELNSGKWDAATIQIGMCGWEVPGEGQLIVFKGSVGVIQWTDEGFRADIQNYLRDLGKNVGSVVTGNCRHQLYSTVAPGQVGACNVSKVSNTTTGTVATVLTHRLKFKTSTALPDGWASSGFVKFTSGNNAGLTYEVKLHEKNAIAAIGESIELFLPCIGSIQVGDTFSLLAGCDHTATTCKIKFSNMINFGGFPHIQVDVNARIENS